MAGAAGKLLTCGFVVPFKQGKTMVKSKKLKKCPFCGGIPATVPIEAVDGGGGMGFTVVCGARCCMGPIRSTKPLAKEAWETRKKGKLSA